MLLNIDYLILNGEIENLKKDWDNIRWADYSTRLEEYSTRNFRQVLSIFDNGKEIAKMFFEPYQGSCLSPGFCQIQFSNLILWERITVLAGKIQDLAFILGLRYTGINRIDIALDGLKNDFSDGLFYMGNFIQDKAVLMAGRPKNISIHATTDGKFLGVSIGKRSGERFGRFYNKTEQLKETPKPWIKLRHGIFIPDSTVEENDVWRLELQLNRKFVSHIENVEVIFNWRFLSSLFEAGLHNFLDLYENRGQKVVARNPKIEIFNRQKLRQFLEIVAKKDTSRSFYKSKRNQMDENTMLANKKELKRMFCRYAVNQDNIAPLAIMVEIFRLDDFYQEYFYRKREYWKIQLSKKGYEIDLDNQKFWQILQEIENSL